MLSMEIEKILYKCVSIQIKTLKRRNVTYESLPQEFSITQLQKSVEDNLSTFEIPISNRRDIYNPQLTEIRRGGTSTAITPITAPIESPIVVVRPIEPDILPAPPYRPERPVIPEPDPIDPPIEISDPLDPILREPEPQPPYIAPIPDPPTIGGGGGSGGDPITRFPDLIGVRDAGGNNPVSQITQ